MSSGCPHLSGLQAERFPRRHEGLALGTTVNTTALRATGTEHFMGPDLKKIEAPMVKVNFSFPNLCTQTYTRTHTQAHTHTSHLQIPPHWCISMQLPHTNALALHFLGEGNHFSVGGKSIEILQVIV